MKTIKTTLLLRALLATGVAFSPLGIAAAQGTPPAPPTPPTPPSGQSLPTPAPDAPGPLMPVWPTPLIPPAPMPLIDFGTLDEQALAAADRAAELGQRAGELAARLAPLEASATYAPLMRLGNDFPEGGPRAPWAQGDPADSIYRSAREAINRGDYRPAAKQFNECTTKFPKSRYADDCGYWEAWARYRLGTMDDLKAAQAAIDAVYSRIGDRPSSGAGTQAGDVGAATGAVRGAGGANNRLGGVSVATKAGPGAGGATTVIGGVGGQGGGGVILDGNGRLTVRGVSFFSDATGSIDVPALRTRIYSALAMRGDTHAADELRKDAARAGQPLCDKEEMSVQAEAMSALSQMDPDGAFPTIRRVLDRKDECSVDLRRNAVSIIARRNDTAAAAVLIQVAKKDTSKSVQETAISYLGRMPGDAAFNALDGLARTSTDDDIQSAVLNALGSSDNPRARQTLLALLDRNPPEKAQIQLIRALARGGAKGGTLDFLRAMYPKAKTDQAKEAIIDGVVSGGGDDVQPFLLGIASNSAESSSLRAYALSRLGRTTIPIAQLAKLYDAADSRSMRVQLITVFGSRKEPEATDKLLDIVKTGTDPEMRKSAIDALIKKNDPRATKLLLELIKPGGQP